VYKKILEKSKKLKIISRGEACRREVEWLEEVYWEVGRDGDENVDALISMKKNGKFS
jgi:hypothetical protein